MKKDKNTISCFSVSFKKGFVSPNIPLATFKQGDKELIFLLDTGSQDNVTNKKALDSIEHTVIDEGENTHTLSGVGGVEDVSRCIISFSCEDETYTAPFLVSNSIDVALDMIKQECGITVDGILGSLFLKDNHVVLDYTTLTAYSKNQ